MLNFLNYFENVDGIVELFCVMKLVLKKSDFMLMRNLNFWDELVKSFDGLIVEVKFLFFGVGLKLFLRMLFVEILTKFVRILIFFCR
jgi:hypothetical protein